MKICYLHFVGLMNLDVALSMHRMLLGIFQHNEDAEFWNFSLFGQLWRRHSRLLAHCSIPSSCQGSTGQCLQSCREQMLQSYCLRQEKCDGKDLQFHCAGAAAGFHHATFSHTPHFCVQQNAQMSRRYEISKLRVFLFCHFEFRIFIHKACSQYTNQGPAVIFCTRP